MKLRSSRLISWLSVLVVCLACTLGLLPSPAGARTLVKMATLVPDGSVWDKILKDMGAEWQEATGGEVTLRIYAGGVAGDEPDVVRKMRIGQLHAAAITVAGLSEIDSGFEIFEIPMFFESYDELFYVLDKMRPILEKRLEAKGYVLLNWGHGGWVHLFSKKPVRQVDDLKTQKLFTWAGDDAMIQLWRRHGFQPVALAATDIMTGLQTGMINALATTPLLSLSLQYFRQTPYMQELGLAPLVGATVITERAWKKMSPEVQKKLRTAALTTEKRLMEEIPDQDARAVEQMTQRGLTVIEVSDEVVAEWRAKAEEFAVYKRENMEATELLDMARRERDAFRARRAAAAGN
ncbi:MAG: hypothetical protein GY856_42525 [bacterium]|nr:hypothetical protein [bacterium]